jgi:hypothetical protein
MATDELQVEAAQEEQELGFEFQLPGGLLGASGLSKEVTMREMTGQDEENIAHPSISQNGGKIITALLKGTVLTIGGKPVDEETVRNLLIGDRDFLMVKLRQITIGDDYTTKVTCPRCQEKFDVKLNLDDLEIKELTKPTYEFPFKLPRGYRDGEGKVHKDGLMKLPTGVEQEFLASAQNKGTATTALLTRCCTKLGSLKAIPQSVIRNLSFQDRNAMSKVIMENMPGPVLEGAHTCVRCTNSWTEPLQVADFFVLR